MTNKDKNAKGTTSMKMVESSDGSTKLSLAGIGRLNPQSISTSTQSTNSTSNNSTTNPPPKK